MINNPISIEALKYIQSQITKLIICLQKIIMQISKLRLILFICIFNCVMLELDCLLFDECYSAIKSFIKIQLLMSDDFTESQMMTLNASNQHQRALNKLSLVWKQYEIINIYQNIFIQYLEQLSTTSFVEMCKSEIELTKNNESFGYSVEEMLRQRRAILQKLEQQITYLQRKENKTEKDIKLICEIIGDLRDVNLHYSELLLNIHNYFKSTDQEEYFSPSMARQFTQLDQDNSHLKKSLLRKFILFSKTYDPFFIKHREVLKTTNNPRLREVKSIQDLFTFPISYAYRLQKAQSSILKYLQRSRPHSKQAFKKLRIISPIRQGSRNKKSNQEWRNQYNSPKSNEKAINKLQDSYFRLDKEIYLSNDKVHNIEKLNIRKRSQDNANEYSPNKSSNRNMSLRSMKERDVYLPRLNNYSSKARDTGKESKVTKQSSISTWRHNTFKSINQMEERQNQIKSLRPKKFQKYSLKRPNQQQVPLKKEIQIQCDPVTERPVQNVRAHSPTPISVSVQTLHQKDKRLINEPYRTRTIQNQARTIQSQEISRPKYKKYQLKASPISIQKIFQTLYSFKFNENYKKIIEIGSWQNSVKHNQYYFHKLFINQELAAISLCCGLPDGDIVLKCWAPMTNCDEQMSTFLFGKFIEHIQKNTLCKSIIYNNFPIKQLSSHSFIMKKDRIYQRLRIFSTSCELDDYYPFLSLNFTNVAINKQSKKQQTLINSHSIEQFQTNNFICFNYLLIINKLMSSGSFSDVSAYYPKLPSLRESNFKILSNKLSPDPYNIQFQCSYCHLLTLRLRNVIRNAFFLADKGYIKLNGQVTDENDDSIIVCLHFLKYNIRMYFGKGIKNAEEMAERCKKAPRQNQEKISFSVRMFKKKLRGRMLSINLKQQNTYGDFELTFSWRDYLKGKIEHEIKDSDQIFDENFFCLIEMERQLLFVFKVDSTNFIV